MEIGVGLDGRLGLGLEDVRDLAREAARRGYASVWTPYATFDPFVLCTEWWRACDLATGVAVIPLSVIGSPVALAKSGTTVAAVTGGRFRLGVGSGTIREIAVVRERLEALRGLVGRVPPVYLGALGPRMLRLAGELADGAALNWCSAEHVAWSRERVAEGARRARRDPRGVLLHEYVRVCVDEDEDAAGLVVARAVLSYALRPPGAPAGAYRAHFERMGFGEPLAELEARRDRGASEDELARAIAPALLARVAAWGRAARVRDGFRRLAQGLDVAVARILVTRPGDADGAIAAIEACRPS